MHDIQNPPRTRGRQIRVPKPGSPCWLVDAVYELRLHARLARFTVDEIQDMAACGDQALAARIVEEIRRGRIQRGALALATEIGTRSTTVSDIVALQDLRRGLSQIANHHVDKAAALQQSNPATAARCLQRASRLREGVAWVDNDLRRLQLEMLEVPANVDEPPEDMIFG